MSDDLGLNVFPTLMKDGDAAVVQGGLSLRDFFAAVVVHGILTHGEYTCIGKNAQIADTAFKLADEMMKHHGEEPS